MTWLGMKRAKKKKTRLAVVHIDEHIVMSRDAAWTYLRLPLVPYEFLSDQAREGLLSHITLALTGLIIDSDGVECHLRITTVPVDPTDWAADLDARTPNPAPGWALYRDHMAREISEAAFVTKEVYLGVMLGPRKGKGSATASKGGILSQFNGLLSKAEEILELDEDVVPADEVEFWTTRAREVERNLGGSYLHAVPAGAAAVARLIRQPLNPGLEVPTSPTDSRPWGPGDVQSLAEGHITNSHKSLMIEQPHGTGHMAVLSLSRFPDVLVFPAQEPWLHYVSSLPFSVEISSRFTIVPSQKVQKDVQKALRTANDMDTHMREAGAAPSLQLQEQLDTATALEFNVGKERMPFIYGRHRIVIHAPNQEELAARYLGVRNHFRDLQIDVVWSTGDQLDLMCELQPADKIRSSSYYQRQELSLLAGGMPTASAEVGDRRDEEGRGWLGPIIGETTSRVRNPVYLSPHVAPARNAPAGLVIIGAPGGGKSFSAFLLTYQMTLQGVITVLIDPKCDAVPMADLPGIGSPELLDLANGAPGILDPFSLADDLPQRKLLAIETLRLLLGGKNLAPERETALLLAVEEVATKPRPSLTAVVELLLNNTDNVEARNLGLTLRTIATLKFAQLCFDPNDDREIKISSQLTIITLFGLELPDASTNTEDYGYGNRLAVAVMYLVTRRARQLMLSLDKNAQKAIVIDEAWAVTATPQGAKLIPEVARMGRSHNCALVVISQNAGDFMQVGVTNSISTVLTFRSKNSDEISAALAFLGMEDTPDNHQTVQGLRNGECLMRDVDNRVARVQIDNSDPALFAAFDTNPLTRGKKAA